MRRLPLALLALPLAAQTPADKLLAAKDPAALMADLKQLTTDYPKRLEGSNAAHSAHHWAAERFKALGLSVSEEQFPLPATWTRGEARARLLGPGGHPVRVAQMGWTPGTKGAIQGPLLLLQDPKDLERLKDRIPGAIVLAGAPLAHLDPPEMQAPLRLHQPPVHEEGFPLGAVMGRLKALGAAAVLGDAGKAHERLTMDAPDQPDPQGLPAAFVPHRAYAELAAAAEKGAKLELELGGKLGGPGFGLNTIAELHGSGKPGECVILGAHLDAWDLGTGATDNGAGTAAVIEAARLLVRSGVRPQRSIRFILFGGEELGYLGSEAYVKAHAAELDQVSAVFVLDTGAGAVDGLAMQGRAAVEPLLLPILKPLAALGVVENDQRVEGGTDHVPFEAKGVPAFCFEQKQHSYANDHHAESDTLDKVPPAELQQAAVVLAYTALQVAGLPGPLPRAR